MSVVATTVLYEKLRVSTGAYNSPNVGDKLLLTISSFPDTVYRKTALVKSHRKRRGKSCLEKVKLD